MKDFDYIDPSGSQPGKLYGLCKAHKQGMPLRPVVSMLNTAEYNLAKFLDGIIKPHLPTQYMLDSTTQFLTKLKQFCFEPTDILVSFDVVSLFTNVPLEQTIKIIADKIYESDNQPKFSKVVFKKLLNIATSGIFLYNGRFYRQIDGVTMGSPLGPTLANFCLAHFETELLSNGTNEHNAPALYLRYVDDTFCVFRSGIPHDVFLSKLNNLHPNLKFTSEIGPSMIPFLDTLITLPTTKNGMFTSKVFRKATYTSLILNFSAMCPFKWKFGLIHCLLHRAYTICSDWLLFHQEVEFLRKVFSKNGYPESLFNSCLNRFLKSKFNKQCIKVKEDGIETLFFVPYIGLPSAIFSKKLKAIFKKYYGIDLKIVFTSFKVKNYFSLKCRTPLPLMANVVYKFQCLRDADCIYIGKTMRHLAIRVKEHGTSASAINTHLSSCSICKSSFSCNNFSILDTGKNDFETTIKEALHIKAKKPSLNKQLQTHGSSFLLNIF